MSVESPIPPDIIPGDVDALDESAEFTSQLATDTFDDAPTEPVDARMADWRGDVNRSGLHLLNLIREGANGLDLAEAVGRVGLLCDEHDTLSADPTSSVYETRRVTIDDIDAMTTTKRKLTYFVEGIIPKSGVFVVFGNPGSCKSWAMLDAALRSLCETPGYFMGVESARIHPMRNILWIYGHEDRGSEHQDQDGKIIDLPVSRAIELLRRPEATFDRDPATSIEFCYCRGRKDLFSVIASAVASDRVPNVIIIDTVTSVVPVVMDMKNGEVAEFYGEVKDATIDADILVIPIGHPRKQSTDSKSRVDPLDKDNILGGAAVSGVISGSLGIHAANPEDVEPDGAGIRIKLTKRNKHSVTSFKEARAHWDAENHIFLEGLTPSESRETRNHITRIAYLTAVRDAARRAGVADGEFVTVRSIRPPEGFTDPDGDPYWPANMTRFRNAIVAAGLLDVGPEPRVTRVSLTARALTEILRFDPEEYGMEGIS